MFLFAPLFAFGQIDTLSFFSNLTLTHPGLEAVSTAIQGNDYNTAAQLYVQFLRERADFQFQDASILPTNYPSSDRFPGSYGDDILQNIYDIEGVTYQFSGPVRWHFNPTDTQQNPSYTGEFRREWTVILNRLREWRILSENFRFSGNGLYIRKLDSLIQDWVLNNPVEPPGTTHELWLSSWRTLDAGARVSNSWPRAWQYARKCPDLADSTLFSWARSWMDHGIYLAENTGEFNWLTTESQGLYTIGIFFPEFQQATNWKSLAIERLISALAADVYPDGSQVELSPHYHRIALQDFTGVWQLARLNGEDLDPIYQESLEAMVSYLIGISMPNRQAPRLNDAITEDVKRYLSEEGLELFPERQDFRWLGTDGEEGLPPPSVSTLFPWAGQAVMRENWEENAHYLLFEYGPYGEGFHQNEDKLGIHLAPYGDLMVFEAGTYTFGNSDLHLYGNASRAHSVITIDGLGQNRDAVYPQFNRAETPYEVYWNTQPLFDYASARFGELAGEGYGTYPSEEVFDRGTWQRHVFYLKPNLFVLIDVLIPNDNLRHTYRSFFHLNADEAILEPNTLRTQIVEPGRPSFSITPLLDEDLEATLIKGQEIGSLLGWELFLDGDKRAIPVVNYTRLGTGPQVFAYAFQGIPAGEVSELPTLSLVETTQGTFGMEVSWKNQGIPHTASLAVSTLGEEAITWQGTVYEAPALIKIGADCLQSALSPQLSESCSYFACDSPDPIWKYQDIGQVELEGNTCEVDDLFQVDASGRDIWDTADAFHFVYQPLQEDGEITARVRSLEDTDRWAKAGVMIRNDLSADAENVMMLFTQTRRWSFQYRSEGGASTQSFRSEEGAVDFPAWVRLRRRGNTFLGYYSQDGIQWQLADSIQLPFSENVWVGLATTSHNDTLLTRALFDQVLVSNGPNTVGKEPYIVESLQIITTPYSDQLTLVLEGGATGEMEVEIVDTLGRRILIKAMEKINYSDSYTLTLPHLTAGAYLLSLQKDHQRQSSWFYKH